MAGITTEGAGTGSTRYRKWKDRPPCPSPPQLHKIMQTNLKMYSVTEGRFYYKVACLRSEEDEKVNKVEALCADTLVSGLLYLRPP